MLAEHGARRRDGHRAGHGAEPLQVAGLHALESGIQVDYVQETVEEHAAKHPQQYDVVTCMEMLEHVPDPQSVVHACARLVKPGGRVFFSTINRNGKASADGGSRGGICHEDGAQRHS
ncbi:methyltransferase domain-containing protein [Klebsiella pneumoniae]|uniref:Methyltransferase domain-containing protein n=1 Tax=Klebsiella pneumoniae TaxID=573 RepID=A0A927HWW9_KLEPN|nr:methyltransferase domain-containing protein [Klebsiella pneumoniae]